MSTAPALTLPDELWIEIFSGYGLEYVDLKCMAGVTKHFNKLEKVRRPGELFVARELTPRRNRTRSSTASCSARLLDLRRLRQETKSRFTLCFMRRI